MTAPRNTPGSFQNTSVRSKRLGLLAVAIPAGLPPNAKEWDHCGDEGGQEEPLDDADGAHLMEEVDGTCGRCRRGHSEVTAWCYLIYLMYLHVFTVKQKYIYYVYTRNY